jgi:hypothetical protein
MRRSEGRRESDSRRQERVLRVAQESRLQWVQRCIAEHFQPRADGCCRTIITSKRSYARC